MRLALVANEASGSGTDVDRVAALLRAAGAEVTVHDFGAAADAAGLDAQRIAVAAGDGSLGLVAIVAAQAGLPLAVIPTGTANDFSRALELPLDVEAAVRLAAQPEATTRAVEVLRAGERPFLNAASIGLSVAAARSARPLKPRLGALAYAFGALRAGLSTHPIVCRVAVDGRELFAGRAWQVIVAGTGAFGAGSRLDVADPSDHRLDVAVVQAGRRAALVRRAYGMRAGRLTDQRAVHHARGRVAEVELDASGIFNVDGELCEVRPPRFEARGEQVRVVVPSV